MNKFPILLIILSPVIALWDDVSEDHGIFNISGVFVDKTLLVETFFRYSRKCKYQVITSPSGFGKTTNLKMLKRFVQLEIDEFGRVKNKTRTSSYKLFTDKRLKISQNKRVIEKHLAEYPVVYFSFDNIIKSEDFVINEINLVKKFKQLYREYTWLYKLLSKNNTDTSGEQRVQMKLAEEINFMANLIDEKDPTSSEVPSMESLQILVQILHFYFGRKVFVLIDNYDAVWIDGLRDNVDKLWFVGFGRHLHEIIRKLLVPEMNEYIEYIFITGTNTVFLHTMSNITYNRFLDNNHPFTQYYGFGENEVIELLERCDIDTENMADLKSSYNGYTTKTSKAKLFQSSSIVEYVTKSNKTLLYADKKYLWLDSGLLTGQWKALFDGAVNQKIKRLVSNESTTFQMYLFCDESELQNLSNILKVQEPLRNITADWFFSLLFENGYFTYTDESACFKVPNQSRMKAFNEVLIKVDKILESVVKAEQYYHHTESTLKVIDF